MSLKKEIVKKSVFFTSWQILSKVIGVIYFSLVAKILKPFEYGILGICMSIFEMFSTLYVCTNNAIIKYVAEKREKSVMERGLKINALIGIILFAILFIFAEPIGSLFNLEISALIRLVAVFLLLSSIKETFSNIMLGTTEIKYYIINEAFFAVTKLVLVSVILFMTYSVFGVFLGLILTTLLTILLSLWIVNNIRFAKGTIAYQTLINYSTKFFVLTIMYQLHPQIFIFLLAKLSTVTHVGFYKFLYGLTSLLIITIPQSFSFMIFPYLSRFSREQNKRAMEKIYNMGLKFALLSSLLISLVFFLIVPFIIHWIFPAYSEATPYILPFLFFGIVTSIAFITGTLIKATNNLDVQLKTTPLGIVLSATLAFVLIPSYGIGGASFAFGLGALFNLILMTHLILKRLDIHLDLIPTKEDFYLVKSVFKKK